MYCRLILVLSSLSVLLKWVRQRISAPLSLLVDFRTVVFRVTFWEVIGIICITYQVNFRRAIVFARLCNEIIVRIFNKGF